MMVYLVEEVSLLGTIAVLDVYANRLDALLAANQKINRRMTEREVIPATESST